MLVAIVWMAACTATPDPHTPAASSASKERPWSHGLPAIGAGPRGWRAARSIVHLHSPWSHDACDGDPLPDGAVNEPCLQDLRDALCLVHVDTAFLTDHPAYAAEQSYLDLFHAREGDEWVEQQGVIVGNRIHCADGHSVLWLPGIEDELMPVSLDRHAAGDDAVENDRLYNGSDAESIAAEREAGAAVFVAHTEQRDLAELVIQQDAGVTGVEIFNLHAMFAPDIRAEALGLDAFGWAADIAPFTSPDGAAEPDLFVLGVLQPQPPSLSSWDALLARGPMVGVGGTDAHQNVLALDLRDGIRGDAYQRMLRWFSNVLWTEDETPAAQQQAIEAGRSHLVFEILGAETGFDLHLMQPDGAIIEMGGSGTGGTLLVGCPTVDARSPHGPEEPEITVRVLRDGAAWRSGCGEHPTDGPGVYRVEVDLVPYHLRPFLGEDPDPWLKPFPWIYSNAIRVGL